MAQIVGVINTSHVWLNRPIEEWDAVRASRQLRDDVPEENLEEKKQKAARLQAAASVLRDKLAEMKPDVLVIFGDDQSENFSNQFLNIPSIAVFVGEKFASGRADDAAAGKATGSQSHREATGHPKLATAILTGLLSNGFDPAFCMDLPNPDRGIGHAIMNPISWYTDYSIPAVPIIVNALFAPQISAKRANQLGTAIRRIVEQYPEDLRVVAVGSGGLWHTTYHGTNTYLNEEFDLTGLKFLEAGDMKGWVSHFDDYRVPDGDTSQWIGERRNDMTGMPSLGGPQWGTRETLNWIAASSAAEGSEFTIVDYVPLYASPIGFACAYCDEVR